MIEKFSFQKGHRSRTIFRICNIIFLTFIVFIIMIPIIKVVSDSLDARASLTTFRLVPSQFTFESYITIASRDFLYRPFLISLFTTAVGTVLSLSVTTLMAYALCQKGIPGGKLIMTLVLITMVFKAGIIPVFLVVKTLHLTNTLWSVLLIHLVDAFYLILMKNFFSTIPKDVMDAAEIDGCSPMVLFVKIILPLSKAGLAAVGLFCMVTYWNDFFNYIMFITNTKLYNFQVILRQMVIESETQTFERGVTAVQSLKNAAVIITIIPVGIVYPFLQKHFVQGVNLGAVKG
jgi:putative aldouronate transport system permease protein